MKYILLDIISYSLLGIGIGIIILAFRGKCRFFQGVISTAGAFLMSAIVIMFSAKMQSGTDIITEHINSEFNILKEKISSLSPEQLQQIPGVLSLENIDIFKNVYTLLFPSVLILNTLLISYVLYMVIKQFLMLIKKDVSKYPKFSELKLRRSASFALMLSYILPYFIWNYTVSAAFSNLTIIIGGVAFVCGFSFVDFRVRQRLKSAWFRFVVYIAAFFIIFVAMPLVVFALVFIAVADSFFDFRGLRRREVKNDGQ